MTEKQKQATQQPPRISIAEFLENFPPGPPVPVRGMCLRYSTDLGYDLRLDPPSIRLHCDAKMCNGIRSFSSSDSVKLDLRKARLHFVLYICKNCETTMKTFALRLLLEDDKGNGVISKLGEEPPFGPPVPARVLQMIEPEKEFYLKGSRAESQGLGIAAFAYYRRVVEKQKGRIFDELIKACQLLEASPELLDELTAAKAKTQFSKAVEVIKHGIPQVLLIDGRNPLTLLHKALSVGLHDQTDEECLGFARSIRVLLTELADRLASVLKDQAELKAAVAQLLKATAPKSGGG